MLDEAIPIADQEVELDLSRLAAIVDAVADGITVQRADGELVLANAEAARATGFAGPAEMLATPRDRILARFELFDEEGRALAADQLPGAVLLGGGPTTTLVVGFRDRATGRTRWSEVTARSVRDEATGASFVVNAFHDITFQRETEGLLRRREAEARALSRRAEQAAARADRLQRLAMALTRARTVRDAVALAVRRGIPGQGARAIAVLLASDDGSALRPADGSSNAELGARLAPGTDEGLAAGLAAVAAVQTGRAQWLGSIDEMAGRFPASAERARRAGVAAMATLPLLVEGEAFGVVVVDFAGQQPFDEGQRGGLRVYADLLAQAIHRIRLAEASARLLAERDAERARLAALLEERLADEARLAELVGAEHARAAELHAIVGAIGDPIVVVAPDGAIRVANRRAEPLLGQLGSPTVAGLLEQLEPVDLDIGALIAESPRIVRERAGARRWFEVSAYPVAEDGAGETILILRDVTEAQQRDAIRDSFIGVLSHELRTPLTTIFGGAKVLARSPGTLDERARVEIFEDIHSEAERLHRLVEDVVALTRFGEGDLVIGTDPILVQRVIPTVVKSESSRWPGGRFEVALPPDLPPVAGDMTYLEQVLRNLMANAMKYGSGSTRVEATVDGDEVAIRVLDDGPGFAAEEAGRLFDLYYRSPSVAKSVSGSGIGLFVCARLVEAMGGRVWAANRPEGGAEFGFTLQVLADEE